MLEKPLFYGLFLVEFHEEGYAFAMPISEAIGVKISDQFGFYSALAETVTRFYLVNLHILNKNRGEDLSEIAPAFAELAQGFIDRYQEHFKLIPPDLRQSVLDTFYSRRGTHE